MRPPPVRRACGRTSTSTASMTPSSASAPMEERRSSRPIPRETCGSPHSAIRPATCSASGSAPPPPRPSESVPPDEIGEPVEELGEALAVVCLERLVGEHEPRRRHLAARHCERPRAAPLQRDLARAVRAWRRWHGVDRRALLGPPRGRRAPRSRARQPARRRRPRGHRVDPPGRRHAAGRCTPRLLPPARRLSRMGAV